MSGSSSARKGANGERELAAVLREYGYNIERFKDGMPTVFHRRSREPWLVTMRLSDWMGLYQSTLL